MMIVKLIMKTNRVFFYLLIFMSFILFPNVSAKSCDDEGTFSKRFDCLKDKYTTLPYKKVEENVCNLTREQCDNNDKCVWVNVDLNGDGNGDKECGVEYNSRYFSPVCYYAADLGGSEGVYIELVMNGAFLESAYFYTNAHQSVGYENIVVIPDFLQEDIDTQLVTYDDDGEYNGVAIYCPSSIYFTTKTLDSNKYERVIYLNRDNAEYANEEGILHEVKLLSDNTFNHMAGIYPENPPEIDEPVREPLTCQYDNLTNGALRVASITYVNPTKIIANYIDDTGMVKGYNVDALYESEAFQNWQCISESSLYVQITTSDDGTNSLMAYISHNPELLPNPDDVHEFNPSEGNDNGNSDDDDDEQDVDNCHLLPPAIDKYLKEALKFLRWGALALMIILGVMDFVKAAMSDDQDALKKAWQKFAKRLIAVIILFLLPILIELILQIARLSGFVECYPSTNY